MEFCTAATKQLRAHHWAKTYVVVDNLNLFYTNLFLCFHELFVAFLKSNLFNCCLIYGFTTSVLLSPSSPSPRLLRLLRLVGSSPAGSSCGGASSVQRAEGGQHRGGQGSPTTPLPLLRPHVLLVEAAQPQPQQPGGTKNKKLQSVTERFLIPIVVLIKKY